MSGRAAERRASARHEAAHAVVAVRLGLPLVSTDIRRSARPSSVKPWLTGQKVMSLGYTAIKNGAAQGWVDAMPDPDARRCIEALAVFAGAGAAADISAGIPQGDTSHADDMQGMVQYAGILGVGESSAEPAVQQFMTNCAANAAAILEAEDDGAAWDRVRAALERKGALTGDEVKTLVFTDGQVVQYCPKPLTGAKDGEAMTDDFTLWLRPDDTDAERREALDQALTAFLNENPVGKDTAYKLLRSGKSAGQALEEIANVFTAVTAAVSSGLTNRATATELVLYPALRRIGNGEEAVKLFDGWNGEPL